MRLFVLWSYFPRYVDRFYASRPDLAEGSYCAQFDALLRDYFTWPVYVPLRMRERGHDVEVMIANLTPANQRWCIEQGLAADMDEFAIVLERVRRFQPDVLFLGPMFSYYGARVAELRRHCRKVVTWIAAPLRPFMNLEGLDLIVTSHANLAEQFRSAGARARTMLPAFEPAIIEALGPVAERDVPVSFVGSLSWAHGDRMLMLQRLLAGVPVRLWILDQPVFSRSMLRPQYYTTIWRYLALSRRSEGEVFGLEMFRVLARSRMTVNAHIGIAGGLSGNQRMFEATGAGALLLTEAASNLSEMFEPGEEVVGYRDPAELARLTRELLDDPERADRIARRGRERTLRTHSSVARSAELEAILAAA